MAAQSTAELTLVGDAKRRSDLFGNDGFLIG
jgi:hypothetical protein